MIRDFLNRLPGIFCCRQHTENMEQSKEYKFSVDLGGMISILSDHLYSSPDVFLRELIQNGADAVNLRAGKAGPAYEGELDILVEKGRKITFTDNGIGLTEKEIHEFVSVIARSSKKEGNKQEGTCGTAAADKHKRCT